MLTCTLKGHSIAGWPTPCRPTKIMQPRVRLMHYILTVVNYTLITWVEVGLEIPCPDLCMLAIYLLLHFVLLNKNNSRGLYLMKEQKLTIFHLIEN